MPPDLRWDHNAWYHRLVLRQLPAHLDDVLDVGCGAGTLAARLALRARHVDAVDRAPHMVALARALGRRAGGRRAAPGRPAARAAGRGVATVAERAIGTAWLLDGVLSGRRRSAREASHDPMPVQDATSTTAEVRSLAGAVLPGVRVRRMLFWRYALIWYRPTARPAGAP